MRPAESKAHREETRQSVQRARLDSLLINQFKSGSRRKKRKENKNIWSARIHEIIKIKYLLKITKNFLPSH